jgi:hypothetical protein
MKKLRLLQEKYAKGEITKEQYAAEIKKMKDEDILEDAEYETALEYDPAGDKPVYTQADVDAMIAKKAAGVIRKALKDAGVEVDAANKDLTPKLIELVKAGVGKDTTATEKELTDLKAKAAKAEEMAGKLQKLTTENAVLKAVGKYNPYSANQVVRALNADYADLLEADDEGCIDSKSIDRALRKLATDEPNLFKKAVDGNDDGAGNNDDGQGGSFKGKGPGGSTGAGTKTDIEKDLAEAKALINLIPKSDTKK